MWRTVTLGDIAKLYQPKTITKSEMTEDGLYPVYGANGIIGRYHDFNHDSEQLVIGCRGSCGEVNVTSGKCWITGNAMVVKPSSDVLLAYLKYYLLQREVTNSVITGTAQPQITRKSLAPVKLLLPPLAEQQRIVEKLDSAFAEIDRAIEYQNQNLLNAATLRKNNSRSLFERLAQQYGTAILADGIKLISGQHIAANDYNSDGIGVGYLTGPSDFGEVHPIVTKFTTKPLKTALRNDVLVTIKGSGIGKVNIMKDDELAISRQLAAIRPHLYTSDFVFKFMKTQFERLQNLGNGAAIPGLSRSDIEQTIVPKVPFGAQEEVLFRIDQAEKKWDEYDAITRQKVKSYSLLKSALLAQELQPREAA